MNNQFAFTFYKASGKRDMRPVQRVVVVAPTPKVAWARFEALYPPKRFTAFHMEKLPAPTFSALFA